MKKLLLIVALVALPMFTFAQNLAVVGAEVEVSARVVSGITLTNEADLNFGAYQVSAGVGPVINAETGDGTNTAAGFTRGRINVDSGSQQAFTIGMSGAAVDGNEVTLYEDGLVTLIATLTFWWDGQNQTAVTLNSTSLQTKDDTVPAEEGTGSLFIGGSLEAVGAVPADTYTQTVTIQVNNF
jgi:hypothetical protein